MALWLIEGLPGAGKSTLAQQLCADASAAGHMAQWSLEESRDHPVHARQRGRVTPHSPGFAQACLDGWAAFVAAAEPGVIHILEGSAFQSTVRFLLEAGDPDIQSYFRQFQALVAPMSPRMVYLRAADPYRHSVDTAQRRGAAWTGKVVAYLEGTPYLRSKGMRGPEGMHRFWAHYADICDSLVATSAIPARSVTFEAGDWSAHFAAARQFMLAFKPLPAAGGSGHSP